MLNQNWELFCYHLEVVTVAKRRSSKTLVTNEHLFIRTIIGNKLWRDRIENLPKPKHLEWSKSNALQETTRLLNIWIVVLDYEKTFLKIREVSAHCIRITYLKKKKSNKNYFLKILTYLEKWKLKSSNSDES